MFENDQYNLFTKRSFILGGIQALLASSLIGRLYFLQIKKSNYYQLLSDKNRIQSIFLLPNRGKIIDCKGITLANNHTLYKVILNDVKKEETYHTVKKISSLLNIDELDIQNILLQVDNNKNHFSIIVKEGLSWEELAKIELNLIDLPGVSIEKGKIRTYPFPFFTCHTVGYVAPPTEKDLKNNEFLNLPGLRIGKGGIEKTFNKELTGQAGIRQIEVNALRHKVRTLETYKSQSGKDLQLTLDISLQQRVFEILQTHKSASSVVLNIHTGAVLACVSQPGFDSNHFTSQISSQNWQNIINDPSQPLINKAISGQYSPGSTFKMIVALAGLEAGAINAHTQFHCPGHYDLYNHRFHCWNWKRQGHGYVQLESALAQSCDVYFYELAVKLGVDNIATTAKKFGLGELTGVELLGEAKGLIPTKSWKQAIKKKPWTIGETLNVSIGQGYVLATPLQLAKMIAILVNGLKVIQPHFIKKEMVNRQLFYNQDHIKLLLNGMEKVVNSPIGTAHAYPIEKEDQRFGGKTGSTQVSRISQEQRDNDTLNDRPYHLKDHALFVGYAPLHNPQFAMSVIVEHGGSGSKVAAPLARDILKATQELISI